MHRVAVRYDKFIVKFYKDTVRKEDIDSVLYWIDEFFGEQLKELGARQFMVFRVYDSRWAWNMIELEDIITVIPLR